MSELHTEGWQSRSLESLAEYLNGFAFNDEHWSEHGLPIVRIAQITGSQGIVDRFPGQLPDSYRLADNDLIFSWSGTLAVVKWIGGPAWLNQHLFKVAARNGVNRSFLFHVLQSSVAEMNKRTHGSTMKHIKRGELQEFMVDIPIDEVEQKQIAEILDALDTTIQQTEAIVDKLKQVKQGLLHDLLTRGIDANGELRPSYEQAPHLYKESPLGWIPNDWEIMTLGQIAARSAGILQTGPFGSQLHAHEYVVEGIPVVMPQDMVDGRLSVSQIARIPQRKAVALSRHRLTPNDVIFSRRGDLSRCVAIEEEHTGWLCGTGCLLARLSSREINGFWLALIYQQPGVQSQVLGRAVGSTMANLNTSILGELMVGRPDINEQNEIARRLKAATQRIDQELTVLAKLKKQKSGLMDDLLTGRVRVTPLLAQAQ